MRIRMLLLALLVLPAISFAKIPFGDLLADITPNQDGTINVLTVFSHPDDETIVTAGTLLKLKKDPRVRLHLLCMTQGDGSDAAQRLGISKEKMAKIRAQELLSAAAVIGADSVIQKNYPDGSLINTNFNILIADVARVIAEVDADLVITHDPGGVTGHPDHQVTSKAAVDAFGLSQAQRLYYATTLDFFYRVAIATTSFDRTVKPTPPSFRVGIGSELKLKLLAFYEHGTQSHFSSGSLLDYPLILHPYEYFSVPE